MAAQQTVLRLLEGQETCNGEINNTQKICEKSHLWMSKLGWIDKERQYEDLDLCDIIIIIYFFLIFQINKLCVFSSSLQVPPHIMHRATKFCDLKLFAKFIFFVESHFQLICVTWHDAAAAAAAAAVRGKCSRGVEYVQARVIQYPLIIHKCHERKYMAKGRL